MAKATKASTKKRSSKKASAKRAGASRKRSVAVAAGSKGRARAAGTKKAAKKPAAKPAKKAAKKAALAKKATKKPAKKTAPAKKPVKRAAEKSVKKARPAKKVAKGAAAKAVKKTVKRAAKKPVRKAAERPVKKAAKKAVKRATKSSVAKAPAAWNQVGSDGALPLPVASPQKLAPKSFQRQYKTWLRRLIGLRRRLLGEASQLEEEALKAGESDVSIDHMADHGSDSFEQEFTLTLIESKSEALRDVDDAIRKIDIGSYGVCEECETLIPRGRLEVLPHARLCIECKSAQESTAGF